MGRSRHSATTSRVRIASRRWPECRTDGQWTSARSSTLATVFARVVTELGDSPMASAIAFLEVTLQPNSRFSAAESRPPTRSPDPHHRADPRRPAAPHHPANGTTWPPEPAVATA